MILVDTNILVPLFIRGVNSSRVQQLWDMDQDWWTESLCLVEFSNVLVTYERQRLITSKEAMRRLEDVDQFLKHRLLEVSNEAVLKVAMELAISAYDARYIVAAMMHQTRLVTEDKRLRKAAPDWTQSMDEALLAA